LFPEELKLSQFFAQYSKILIACFGFLLNSSSLANSTPDKINFHQKLDRIDNPIPSQVNSRFYEKAVTSDLEYQVRTRLNKHFISIGQKVPKYIKFQTLVTLDHSSGEPWVKQVDMDINLGPALPNALVSDIRLFLRGWFKSQGYQSATAAEGSMAKPLLKLNVVSLGKKPTLGINLGPYLVVATAILIPVLLFFFSLGVKWQFSHFIASRQGKRLYENNKQDNPPDILLIDENTPNLDLIVPEDMQSLFSSMSFNQAIKFLRPLKDGDREVMFERLKLKGPVRQLVMEELEKS
jgi:hypothetical protein